MPFLTACPEPHFLHVGFMSAASEKDASMYIINLYYCEHSLKYIFLVGKDRKGALCKHSSAYGIAYHSI
jgi:hypothetical protein